MKVILETDRLILREITVLDASFFYHLNLDEAVMRYTGDVAFESVLKAQTFIESYPDYIKNGYGRWVVLLKPNLEEIGWCGLKKHNNGEVDLGYRFFKNFWGKGFATESASACLDYGFNTLGLQEIIGRVAQKNLNSVNVLKKIKMNFWKIDDCKGIGDSLYYKLAKNEYEIKKT